MKRSERLAIDGLVEVRYFGGLEIAKVSTLETVTGCRYVATDFDCLYDGREVTADIYESNDCEQIYAIIY